MLSMRRSTVYTTHGLSPMVARLWLIQPRDGELDQLRTSKMRRLLKNQFVMVIRELDIMTTTTKFVRKTPLFRKMKIQSKKMLQPPRKWQTESRRKVMLKEIRNPCGLDHNQENSESQPLTGLTKHLPSSQYAMDVFHMTSVIRIPLSRKSLQNLMPSQLMTKPEKKL